MKMIIAESLTHGLSYAKYRDLNTKLLAKGESTAAVQSEALTAYSVLNEARMDRLDKKLVISQDNIEMMLRLKSKYLWLVISEGWCGDAAQTLPVMNKLAILSDRITMKIVLRDQNLPLIDMFLTNGSRSIPKLIILDRDTSAVLGDWGPRPKGATNLISSYRSQYGAIDETVKKELHLWYAHDKGSETQREIATLMMRIDQKTAQNHSE